MNEKQLEFDLVRGKYKARMAMEILINLISDKINFHQVHLFGCEERNDADVFNSRKRIAELKADLAHIKAFLLHAEKEDLELSLDARVRIVPQEKTDTKA